LAEAGGEAEEVEPAELEDRGDDDTPVTSEASAAVTSHIVTRDQYLERDVTARQYHLLDIALWRAIPTKHFDEFLHSCHSAGSCMYIQIKLEFVALHFNEKTLCLLAGTH
jgi:hypothetical protein